MPSILPVLPEVQALVVRYRSYDYTQMMKLKRQPDPIELTVNLPPDGTYPPRIVSKGSSLWLPDNTEAFEFADGVFLHVSGRQWSIYQEHDRADVRVNNQILIGRRVLKDGDFIHSEKKKIRAIFQADPVADYRQGWEAENEEELTPRIQLSKRVAEHVVIDADGMSLDGGETFARWDTITALDVCWEYTTNNWAIRIQATNTPKRGKTLPSKFHSAILGRDEIFPLLTWIFYAVPFQLSIQQFSRIEIPDAYKVLVYDKILTPAYERKRDLPATPAFILGLKGRCEAIIIILVAIVFMLCPSLVIWFIVEKVFHVESIYILVGIYLVILLLQWKTFRDKIFYLRHLSEWETLDLPPRFFGVEDIVDEKQGEHAP